ncbi:sterol desaturase family protein [Alteraurantiacibacter aquimixticola]|uniref:Sterol desaturase family protein n=1 Tax=Alteraurantiacibacter aquimixticola TaxID=2489173 RepID=A0A4T3EYZ7_9SPHN|nr:sterol desaturase family protein [Alteraurantiacibacter aquimixticola]TIX49364.1 sterol desaturase family protein [Alteraurantiacibacter aquimixticola]
MTAFDPLPYAIPFFVALIALEIVWARRTGRQRAYESRDTAVSLGMGMGSLVAGALAALATVPLLGWVHGFAPFAIGWAWWAWALCFILDDFAYYWQHRTGHRVRWFWAAHVNHHSSQHYNLSTALRQTWTSFVALSFIFRLPLALIGFEPGMILTCAAFNLIYQFWIHTEAINRMPRWFEAVMNTPSHHRVHHATNGRYLDRNYAGTFIVWDKLFGTFELERDDEVIRYGIVHQLGSFNIVKAAFHEWADIARDVRSAPWKHKLSYMWREPGWTHDGSRETSDMIRQRTALAEQETAES